MNASNDNVVRDFEEFVKIYHDSLYNYLRKLVGDSQDAEDILQEVLIKIADRLPDLREPEKVKTWAFRIATNTAVDTFRKRERSNVVFDESLINETGAVDDFEDRLVLDEMNDCIRMEMSRMAPRYYMALVLYYFEHMTVSEISNICDISEASVRIRLHRGKNLLHRILSEGCDFYYDRNSNIRCSRTEGGSRFMHGQGRK